MDFTRYWTGNALVVETIIPARDTTDMTICHLKRFQTIGNCKKKLDFSTDLAVAPQVMFMPSM